VGYIKYNSETEPLLQAQIEIEIEGINVDFANLKNLV
jgi:hypothetical protein